MTTTEQNKTIVREFIDGLFTKGDLGAVDTYLAGDFINHDPPFGQSSDREGMRGAAAMFRAAFPDWHTVIDHAVVSISPQAQYWLAEMTDPGSPQTIELPLAVYAAAARLSRLEE